MKFGPNDVAAGGAMVGHDAVRPLIALGLDEKVGFNVEHHRMANGHDVVYIDVART